MFHGAVKTEGNSTCGKLCRHCRPRYPTR